MRCFHIQLHTCTFSIGFTIIAFGAVFSLSATYLYIFYRIYYGIWFVVFSFSYRLVHFLSNLLLHLGWCFLFQLRTCTFSIGLTMTFGALFSLAATDLYIFYQIYYGIWCVVFSFSYGLVHYPSDLLWHLVRCFLFQLRTCTFSIGFTMAFDAMFSLSATDLYIFNRIYYGIWCVVFQDLASIQNLR